MGLSVVILSKDAGNLVPCVEAVRKHEPTARIIVVDDGIDLSSADSKSPYHCWLCDMDPMLRVPGQKPFIFSRNANIGIQAAEQDDVVLLNDDALLESPGGFSLMQRDAQEHPEFGIVGATTNVTGQPLQWRRDIGLREVPHIAFVCVLLPRRTVEQLGGLDERYCLDYGCEDRDYCEAVTRAGLKVGVHDGCYVDHGSLHSTYRGDPRAPKSFEKNYRLFRQKWGIA